MIDFNKALEIIKLKKENPNYFFNSDYTYSDISSNKYQQIIFDKLRIIFDNYANITLKLNIATNNIVSTYKTYDDAYKALDKFSKKYDIIVELMTRLDNNFSNKSYYVSDFIKYKDYSFNVLNKISFKNVEEVKSYFDVCDIDAKNNMIKNIEDFIDHITELKKIKQGYDLDQRKISCGPFAVACTINKNIIIFKIASIPILYSSSFNIFKFNNDPSFNFIVNFFENNKKYKDEFETKFLMKRLITI